MDLSDLFGRHDVTWMDNASCAGIEDPDIFFPPRDKVLYKKIADEAKTYCNSCPVRKECLWYAISSDETHGIWGGLSHRERNALVRKWQREYKRSMTLKEFIFQVNKRGKINGNNE
ncbi:Transcription factor WhiB [uncultured Caudovirales phage]|uniref:Transcription factor WhiB n=1 Tax=uncultured Caudovirales phage TaxID=2100421 RepID=A0A6J7WUJ1_9CAUD|nr:Transcription factor WhiB [uncultured Caudovirales phage]CAB5219764.1 Transcription factor WhiB [uncultured Caudovirales phage]